MINYKVYRNKLKRLNEANGRYEVFRTHGASGLRGLRCACLSFIIYHLLFIISLPIFTSCSSDSDEEEMVKGTEPMEIEVQGFVSWFEEEIAKTRAVGAKGASGAYEANGTNRATTRAWTPPTGYTMYEDEERSISVFFTQNHDVPVGGYEEEYFFKSGDKWRVSKTDLAADTYYLYGYIPHERSADPATVSLLTGEGKTFADGAVLSLSNFPAISPADVCVVIGAKNGYENGYTDSGDYNITGLKPGDFAYAARTTGEGGTGGNYVFLLFDHLYAALNVRLQVHADYAALRTIKLKELRLQAATSSGFITHKTDINVTLTKTTDGTSPIAKDGSGNDLITYTPTASAGDAVADTLLFQSNEGVELKVNEFIDGMPYKGYFMPKDVTKLVLYSVYDVYDTKGNLTRENCRVKNTLVLNELWSGHDTAKRGYRYTVNLTIKPTYLYVMSDPDLDNPSVVVN